MELLFLIIGVIIGFIFASIIKDTKKIYGVIDVDHEAGLCQAHITSDELTDRRNTKVMFKVNHNAKISREEQTL